MSELFLHFTLVVALASILTALVIRAPGRLGVKVIALMCAAGLAGAAYLSGAELLGRPKPVRLALLERAADEAAVVGSMNVEGEAIYLWLVLPGETAPRAFRIPWSASAAQALQRARGEGEVNGTGVRMRRPFEDDEAMSETRFYAPPPPPMPPKPVSQTTNGPD